MKAIQKILAALTAAGMLAGMLAGCGSTGATASTAAPSTEPETTQAITAAAVEETSAPENTGGERTQYPLTITTYNYAKEPVTFTFEKAPQRVFAQNQNNIETLLALGLADKIVGAFGGSSVKTGKWKEEFSKVNYYESQPSKEDIIALEPDFITGWYSTFDDKRLGDVDFWHERGIGTYMSLNSACRGPAAENPQTVDHECQDILTLGMIFDVQDKAEEIVAEIKGEISKVEDYLADKDRLTVAVLEDEGGTYRVYGEDVLGGNVAMAGGADLAVGKHGNTGNISAEDLIAANPDAIFMVWYGGYSVNDTDYAGDQVIELITKNPAFASLDAVKNNRVFPVNLSYAYCTGMCTADAVRYYAQSLYPELYQ